MSCTGVPGRRAAIDAASTMTSTSARRPKPPPRNGVCTVTASLGKPAAFAANHFASVGAWLPAQTSQRPSLTSAVAFIGSIVACAR